MNVAPPSSNEMKNRDSRENVCRYRNKRGRYKGDCRKGKRKDANMNGLRRPDNGGPGHELDDTEKAMVPPLCKSETKRYNAIYV